MPQIMTFADEKAETAVIVMEQSPRLESLLRGLLLDAAARDRE